MNPIRRSKPLLILAFAGGLAAGLAEAQRKGPDTPSVRRMPLTTVLIVRHADKAADGGLSELGIARARELVHVVGSTGIDAIYISSVPRTNETARYLGSPSRQQRRIRSGLGTAQ